MQTPRPDHFTYPAGRTGRDQVAHPWLRAVFVAGLIAAFTLGLVLTLGG
ncbi:hypothetical protein [Dongia sp.]